MKTKKAAVPVASMKRAVVYARYSTDLQNERSIADQIGLMRTTAERMGGVEIIATYDDKGKSGATMSERPALLRMIADAKQRKFDIVLVEDLDRLSRDLEDTPGIYKRLTYYDVEIHTPNISPVTPMHVTFGGMMNSAFLVNLSNKVRRHHTGMAKEGRFPTGVPYGYCAVDGKPGVYKIDPERARIVQRIFREFSEGASPRAIALGLTRDGILAPKGGAWGGTTISGGGGDSRGITGNRLYLGELRWGANKCDRDPDTQKKTRKRSPTNLTVVPVPHMQIIDQKLWDACALVKNGKSVARKIGAAVPRGSWALAGILVCGECGGKFSVRGASYGSREVVCSAGFRDKRKCSHGRSYRLNNIDQQTIKAIYDQFSDPSTVARLVSTYEKKFAEFSRRAKSETAEIAKRLSEIEGATLRLVNALEKGNMPEDIIVPKLQKLETERLALQAQERLAESDVSRVTVHPATIKRWYSELGTMTEIVNKPDSTRARAALRQLLLDVIVHPVPAGQPYRIEPRIRLAAIGTQPKEGSDRRTAAQIAQGYGVAVRGNAHTKVTEWEVQQNAEHAVSLGISVAA